jgi:hypothetical protein
MMKKSPLAALGEQKDNGGEEHRRIGKEKGEGEPLLRGRVLLWKKRSKTHNFCSL